MCTYLRLNVYSSNCLLLMVENTEWGCITFYKKLGKIGSETFEI